jgi:hypothetical protein
MGAPASFEYRSRLKVAGLPLVHVVHGIDPCSGRRPPAVGVVAVGQVAVGLIAVGQVAVGAISIGQAAIGLGWGIGQLSFGLLAAGQVAAGLLGAVGQVAVGPHAIGMVTDAGAGVAVGWLLGGLCLGIGLYKWRARLAPLFNTPAPTSISAVRDGCAHVAGEVVSNDRLSAPLSSRPCVFWHAVHVGPAVRSHERAGGEVTIADGSGTARIDLSSEVIFIRNDDYREIAGPDWALHLETALSRGDSLHVAGPVRLEQDAAAGSLYRGGGVSPLFSGRADQPLVVTTRNPAGLRSELRFASALAWALVLGGAIAAVAL